MKKPIFIFLYLLLSVSCFAQDKYFTKNGEVSFEASVPSFEEIKAKSTTVTAILNADTGELAALTLMKGFRFKIALMEEHFNENYVESDQYPKATFSGKLENFRLEDIGDKDSTFPLEGILNLHGKDKNLKTTASVSRDGNNILIRTKFMVKPEDFNIKIPGLVSEKIAKEVGIDVNFSLQKK